MNNFINFHTKTQFSLLQSLIPIDKLFSRTKELDQPAASVCDTGSLAAGVPAYKAAKKHGVKLLMGLTANFVDSVDDTLQPMRSMVLIAKNHQGYQNLLKLNHQGFQHRVVSHKRVYPRIDWRLLENHAEGLLCLTGDATGILGQLICNRQLEKAEVQAKRLFDIFGSDLGLEVVTSNIRRQTNDWAQAVDQQTVNNQMVKLSKKFNIPIIPTSNAHYLTKEQAESHDVMLAMLAQKAVKFNNRLRLSNDNGIVSEFYLKTREEIVAFFQRMYPEAPAWCDNTLDFASRCEEPAWIMPQFSANGQRELPTFPVKDADDYSSFQEWLPEQAQEVQSLAPDKSFLRYRATSNLRKKVLAAPEQEYLDRFYKELDVLENKGFSSYMLICADILDWCRKNQIPIGPARGSCGNSLLAYLLDIHKIDSVKYKLLFERFQNKDRVLEPDCDLDVSQRYKGDVEQYIIKKYGQENVAFISTFLTLSPKPYVKKIAQVFQYGGGFKEAVQVGNALSEAIPEDKEIHTIEDAIKASGLFAEYCIKYPEIQKYAKDICGVPCAYGAHAGGIVPNRRPLVDIAPLRIDKDGFTLLEVDKDLCEEMGLVKIDILGIETLDIIEETFGYIRRIGKPCPHSIEGFTYDQLDDKVYQKISQGDTLGVFQLGTSATTINLCKHVKPKNIIDVALINALARPSAAEIREKFVETRDGKRRVNLVHSSLQRALGFSYGFGLFDDSLLLLAADVAGWDLNQADRFRKMTKDKGKNPEKTAKLKSEFIRDAIGTGIPEATVNRIWNEVIESFAAYGFNYSHSLGYSFLGFLTAYLKTYYPLEFLAANLVFKTNSTAERAKKVVKELKREIRGLGVKILPPDINKSETSFTIIDDKTLLFGLEALKFMGKDAIPEILAHRPYTSFQDFMAKVSPGKVRMPSVKALIAAGCFDSFGHSRKQLYLYADDYRKKQTSFKNRQAEFNYPFPEVGEWTVPEKYAMEHSRLAEGVSGSAAELHPTIFKVNEPSFPQVTKDKSSVALRGMVLDFFEWKVKNEESKLFQQEMARLVLLDPYGNSVNLVLFPDTLELFKKELKLLSKKRTLEAGAAIEVLATLDRKGEGWILTNLCKFSPFPAEPEEQEKRQVVLKLPKKNKKLTEMSVLETAEVFEEKLAEAGEIEEETLDIETILNEELLEKMRNSIK